MCRDGRVHRGAKREATTRLEGISVLIVFFDMPMWKLNPSRDHDAILHRKRNPSPPAQKLPQPWEDAVPPEQGCFSWLFCLGLFELTEPSFASLSRPLAPLHVLGPESSPLPSPLHLPLLPILIPFRPLSRRRPASLPVPKAPYVSVSSLGFPGPQ